MIPSELTTIDHWISWKPVNKDKKPLDPTGRVAFYLGLLVSMLSNGRLLLVLRGSLDYSFFH
jgi:hypothetical protein